MVSPYCVSSYPATGTPIFEKSQVHQGTTEGPADGRKREPCSRVAVAGCSSRLGFSVRAELLQHPVSLSQKPFEGEKKNEDAEGPG
jgi:hypothetical protein